MCNDVEITRTFLVFFVFQDRLYLNLPAREWQSEFAQRWLSLSAILRKTAAATLIVAGRGSRKSRGRKSALLARVIGDEAFEHRDEAHRRTLGAEALHADARAFAEEKHLVGEEIGLDEHRSLAKPDEPFAILRLVLLDDAAQNRERLIRLCEEAGLVEPDLLADKM